ncbi:hypothetical protein ACTQ49_08045 [Luteococcus sp. Sow4_B9]|uniref:hypothetical protein n=1 Tax=Luteococcus sp. Sow4_B9 TaxID=3438792 RepID=UPI003F97CD8E
MQAQSSWTRHLGQVLGLYALTRILGLLALYGLHQRESLGWRRVFAPWDGPFYLDIAHLGYPDEVPQAGQINEARGAFFPLFPLVVRALVRITQLPPVTVAVVLNLCLGAVAAALMLWLGRRITTPLAARRAALLFVVMPGLATSTLVMSDPLMVTLAIASMAALHDRRWLVAGLLAADASATRPNGVGLVAAGAVAGALCWPGVWPWLRTALGRSRLGRWLLEWQEGQARLEPAPTLVPTRGAVLAPALAPLGILGYWVWLGRHTGDPAAWFTIQDRFWGQGFDLGWKFWLILKNPLELVRDPDYMVTEAGFLFLALVVWAIWRGARIPWVPAAYALLLTAQMVLFSGVGPRGRFLMAAFPLFWLVGQKLTGRWFVVVCVFLVPVQMALTWAWSAQVVIP